LYMEFIRGHHHREDACNQQECGIDDTCFSPSY
jgi:hypothetical protein